MRTRGWATLLLASAAITLAAAPRGGSQPDPLPSWNDGAAQRAIVEFVHARADGLPDSKVGTFSQALYDEAAKNGWIVVRMKSDWKKIFAF